MTMKKFILLGCFFLAAVMLNAQSVDPRLDGIEKQIEQLLKEWEVSGASIAIVEKDKVLMAKGFGFKDYEQKLPATENTLFAIGSCTKAFTAALFCEPVGKGTIDLDKPVQLYYPALHFKTNELNNLVSIRDMLTHRTGLPRHDFAWYSGAATSREAIVQQIRNLEPSYSLRATFQYNNYMYIALGALLEKQLGKTWEQQIQDKFFTPLGMTRSTTGTLEGQKDFAYGYKTLNNEFKKLPFLPDYLSGVAPAGGIWSTARDMSNWLLMWTNQGKFKGKEVISNQFYSEAISSQMVVQPNLPTKYTPDYFFFNYGLGWYLANYRGHYGVGHGGNINGFSSFITFLPADSVGVFISLNQNNSPLIRVLNNLLIDKMINAPYRDWNSLIKATIRNPQKVTSAYNSEAKPTHTVSQFAGTYFNDGYGKIVLTENNGLLNGTFNKWQLNLKHARYNYFSMLIGEKTAVEDDNMMNAEFLIDKEGNVSGIKVPFELAVSDIHFVKQAQVSNAATAIDLKKYVGEYSVLGTTAKIYLAEESVLKAIMPGQPEFILEVLKEGEFSLKGQKGVKLIFMLDPKGKVTGFTLIQPNGKFTATKK